MYNLMIAAFPEAAATVIVMDEDDNEVYRTYTFYSGLVPAIHELLDSYGEFETATIYGPRDYINGIEELVGGSFEYAEIAKVTSVAPGEE